MVTWTARKLITRYAWILCCWLLCACEVAQVGASDRGASDTTPPVIRNGEPSAPQPASTTQVTLSVSTDEAATCNWGTADAAYASLPNTFATTGGTSHTTTVSGLADGASYLYYVRCQDAAGNAN